MIKDIVLDEVNASKTLLGFSGDLHDSSCPVFDERYPLDARILSAIGSLPAKAAGLQTLLFRGKLFPDHFFELAAGEHDPSLSNEMTLTESEAIFDKWYMQSRGVSSLSDLTPDDSRTYVDNKDIWMLRAYTVNGVCPDGGYLYGDAYEKIMPVKDPTTFLKHMVEGFSASGNDHMAIRRNLGNVPNGVTGFLKDGANARSHSSLMHDLRIAEFGVNKDFPVEIVAQYAALNLFEGYYCQETLGSESAETATIRSSTEQPAYSITLHKAPDSCVAVRMLSTAEGNEPQMYDFSCYAAEIVAIALACDLIIKKTGRDELLPEGFSCYERLLSYAAEQESDRLIEDIRAFCTLQDLNDRPFMLPYAWFSSRQTVCKK